MNSKEPLITINGIVLNEGQSMTLRVAVESFIGELMDNGLGDDAHGIAMKQAYLDRLGEVRELMFRERMLIKTRL